MKRFTDAPIALTVISASMALIFGACTTGQPRAARINNDFVQPDTSGRVLYMEPVEPTARASSSVDAPQPQPTSNTRSPLRGAARASNASDTCERTR